MFSGFIGLNFVLRFLAKAMLKQAYHYSYDLTKTLDFMFILCEFFVYSLPPYTIPFPLAGERDVSFWRYGVSCFISSPLGSALFSLNHDLASILHVDAFPLWFALNAKFWIQNQGILIQKMSPLILCIPII